MAKKAELLEQAKDLGLDVTSSMTIVQIEELIKTTKDGQKNETDAEHAEDAKNEERHYAKSGKRSEKVERETIEKIEKEERKLAGDTSAQDDDEAHVKKGPAPKTRSKLERRGKNYRKIAGKLEAGKAYSLADAMKLAAETNPVKFDATVELHVRLGVDPRQADQNIRTTVNLPHGTGKTVRVAVFAPEDQHAAAKKAGADVIGDEEFLKQLDKEQLDFDVLVATPAYMPRLGKYARLLGPRGLMPNPKSGTVAADVEKAVTEAKGGKVEYRVDKQAIVHLPIGKVSFGAKKLEENAAAFFDSLKSQKPSSLKGVFVKSVNASTTMGPGITIENVLN